MARRHSDYRNELALWKESQVRRARSSWKANVVIGLLWLNFVVLWFRVFRITTVQDVTDSINYLGGLVAAYGLLVTWWVFHNIRISRKKRARSARMVRFMATHDSLQQYISRKTDLHGGQEILINVVGDRKVFIHPPNLSQEQPVTAGKVD
jgi:hypothetical protein